MPQVVCEKRGGRKKARLSNPTLVPQLQENLALQTAGSPVQPGKLWTNRSSAELADELQQQGHSVDRKTVERILKNELHLGHRQIAKKLTMDESMDRDAQFQMVQHYSVSFSSRAFRC